MFPISDTFEAVREVDTSKGPYWFWIYDAETKDFHLKYCQLSYHLTTEAYKLSIGDNDVTVPADYNLAICSEEGDVDWIRPVEIVGRDFDAVVITQTLTQGVVGMESIRVIGYDPAYQYILPFTKYVVPVIIGGGKAVLLSEPDIYCRFPSLHISDIV